MHLFRKLFISAFIIFNFLTMIRVHLPLKESKYFSTLFKPIDAYLTFFSIYQDWFMFAPNPARLNVKITADIEFLDGTTDSYDFEKSKSTTLLEKYTYGERYRKLMSESVRKDDHSYMWKDTAKFALRKVRERNLHKIPLKVHLKRHWDEIPLLEEGFRPHLYQAAKYEVFKFYTYEVI